MLKRISWIEDDVFCIELRNNLFTLAQMRTNHIMQFFDLSSSDGNWNNVNLNEATSLFFVFVAENRLKPIFVKKVERSSVTPSREAVPRLMLSAIVGHENRGAALVELTDDYSSYGAQIVKAQLSTKHDLDLIYRHELTGMVGDPEKLRIRLCRFFDTGVNWDDAKGFLFSNIPLPPALGTRSSNY